VLNSVRCLSLVLAVSVAAGSVQPALAMGGGGPPVWTMTQKYCTQMVVNKGILDIDRFQREVRKCMDNPVTYPPAYK
jgi:hypothetical protein